MNILASIKPRTHTSTWRQHWKQTSQLLIYAWIPGECSYQVHSGDSFFSFLFLVYVSTILDKKKGMSMK